jgi:hypothetical protein
MPLLEATDSSLPRSALRYRPIGKDTHPQRSHPRAMGDITPVVKRASRLRAHPLLYLGVGMMAMLALWTLLTMAISWGNLTWPGAP